MVLAVLLAASAVYGSLADYFSGDALFYGATSIGAALLGFAFGWFARGGKKQAAMLDGGPGQP